MSTYVHRALPAIPMAGIQGTLALDLRVPSPREPVPMLTLLPGDRAELEAFAHRFASVVVEVVGGDRGPGQLLRWTSEQVYADLLARSAALQRTTPSDRRVRRLRPQVRSVRVFCPTAGAAEVSVHVRQGERSRAIAARLELLGGRWVCVALQFG